MQTTAAIFVVLFAIASVPLTLITLPGAWLAIIVAALCKWWQFDLISWWALGIAAGLAVLGEIAELGVSAVGTAKAGGSKRGSIGSLAGGIVGAIVGSPFLFPLGTILGAALGAGLGAAVAEKFWAKRDWNASVKSGQGAAVGRVVATLAKTLFAGAGAMVLIVSVLIEGF